jgi:hypothetical protein
MEGRTMRYQVLVVAVMSTVGFTACASLKNTPAQDQAWERWQQCKHFPNITLKEIRANGEVWVFTGDGSHNLGPWRTCMQDALAAQRAAGRTHDLQLPLGAAEVHELVRFAYFTTQPPVQGTFLRSAVLSNMPPKATSFTKGAPVTFFYAVTQLGRVLDTEILWTNPKGDLVKSTKHVIDQSRVAGTSSWVWRTDTHLPSSRLPSPVIEGSWSVELIVDGHKAGRYDFTVAAP